MKKFYFTLQCALFSVVAFGQVQFNFLDGFGKALYDINSNGNGLHGNGYYSFANNTSATVETGVGSTVAITNSGKVLGLLDDGSGNYVPALKNGETWAILSGFPAEYSYTLYDISENGKYIVGQTQWTEETGAWGFIYNTETAAFKLLSSDLYEYGAAYTVNDAGIAVGWVDDLPSGTWRMPAYFKEDGSITLIDESYGEASSINANNEIVGAFGDLPFYFKIGDSSLKTFSLPEGQLSGSFTAISDTGLIVGYVQTYIELEGWYRVPVIYDSSFGTDLKLLADVLAEQDIDTANLNGTAYKISTDGKYIAGFGSGAAFFAPGWAVYLDDLFTLSTQNITAKKIAVYPNPVKDILNIRTEGKVQNVAIYNMIGQKINSVKTSSEKVDVSNLAKGIYVIQFTVDGKIQSTKFVKE